MAACSASRRRMHGRGQHGAALNSAPACCCRAPACPVDGRRTAAAMRRQGWFRTQAWRRYHHSSAPAKAKLTAATGTMYLRTVPMGDRGGGCRGWGERHPQTHQGCCARVFAWPRGMLSCSRCVHVFCVCACATVRGVCARAVRGVLVCVRPAAALCACSLQQHSERCPPPHVLCVSLDLCPHV